MWLAGTGDAVPPDSILSARKFRVYIDLDKKHVYSLRCTGAVDEGQTCCSECKSEWYTRPTSSLTQGAAKTDFHQHVVWALSKQDWSTLYDSGGQGKFAAVRRRNARGFQTMLTIRAKAREQFLAREASLHKVLCELEARWDRYTPVERDNIFDLIYNCGRQGHKSMGEGTGGASSGTLHNA